MERVTPPPLLSGETALLDRCFLTALAPLAPREVEAPRLMPVADLQRLQYFEQFPRQAVVTDAAGHPARDLGGGTHVLLPAACYPIYLALADRTLDGPVCATAVARCTRSLGDDGEFPVRVFTQRKVVFFGTEAYVREQVGLARAAIAGLAASCGLDACSVAAPPPASLREAARALFAVDDALVAGDDTLAQFNFHRQHYSRLCETRTGDGRLAFGACIGLLHESWLAALARGTATMAPLLAASTSETSGGRDVSSPHL